MTYVRHTHVTRKGKKANLLLKQPSPLPIDNLLLRKRTLMGQTATDLSNANSMHSQGNPPPTLLPCT